MLLIIKIQCPWLCRNHREFHMRKFQPTRCRVVRQVWRCLQRIWNISRQGSAPELQVKCGAAHGGCFGFSVRGCHSNTPPLCNTVRGCRLCHVTAFHNKASRSSPTSLLRVSTESRWLRLPSRFRKICSLPPQNDRINSYTCLFMSQYLKAFLISSSVAALSTFRAWHI